MRTDELKQRIEDLAASWYSPIDFGDGVVTPGSNHVNEVAIMQLLQDLDLKGRKCLEIGVADGKHTLQLCAKGAKIVAHDIIERETYRLVAEHFAFDFPYITGDRVEDIPGRMRLLGHSPFELIMFCGVLYHTPDPVRAILSVRQMCAVGSLVLFESACVDSPEASMYFNVEGALYGNTYSYWFTTPSCLRYLMLLAGFELLDERQAIQDHTYPVVRHAILARAVPRADVEKAFPWLHKAATHRIVPHLFPDLEFGNQQKIANPIPATAHISHETLCSDIDRYKCALASLRDPDRRRTRVSVVLRRVARRVRNALTRNR